MSPPESDRLAHDADETGESPWVDLARLVSLSDGIFAFAMTLLAIGLVVPMWSSTVGPPENLEGWLGAALQQDAFQFLAYAFTFTMIAIWWIAHQRLFLRIRRADRAFQWMNLFFLMAIAVSPFVLRLLVTSGFASTLIGVEVFLGAQGATSLLLTGMTFYATTGRRLVDPTLSDRVIENIRLTSLGRPAIFLWAIGIALIRPDFGLYALSAIYVFQAVQARRRKLGDPNAPPLVSERPDRPG